jgi:hypothetical protein
MNLIKTLLRGFGGVYGVAETITPAVGEILNIVYMVYNIAR